MTFQKNILMCLLVCLLPMLLAWPDAAAQELAPVPVPPNSPSAAPPATPIATGVAATESQDIAQRIRDIFNEITSLRTVQVRVSAGVVTLSGTVQSAEDVKRAEAIAARVAGVVTVQNDLERDLDVTTNLTPTLGQFKTDVKGLLRALPLLGVALGVGLLIMGLGYLLASVNRLWRWIMPNPFLAEIAATFIRFLAIVLGLVAALEVMGATALLSGVLGGAGVVGIALGFAARDMAGNYMASLMLSLRQPFRANDWVVIEGYEGRVVRLTSRATVLMTLDGNHLRIPNLLVFKAVILNYTCNSQRRFSFDLGVEANDNPIDAMAVGLKAMNALKFVLAEPAAMAVIENVGDSNIVLRFYGWVDQKDTDFLKGRSLSIQATKSALEGAGFALPEPIYRLRFDQGAEIPLGSSAAAASPDPVRLKPPPILDATNTDTSPDKHIERLVAKERASANEDDLLDNAKPIE